MASSTLYAFRLRGGGRGSFLSSLQTRNRPEGYLYTISPPPNLPPPPSFSSWEIDSSPPSLCWRDDLARWRKRRELFFLFIYSYLVYTRGFVFLDKTFRINSSPLIRSFGSRRFRNYVYYFKSVKPRINAIVVCSRERENCLNAFKRKIKRVYIFITKFY